MHGIPNLPRPCRFALAALAGAAVLALMMLVPLMSAANAVPSIPIATGATTSINLTPLIETAFWAINALLVPAIAALATILLRKLKLDKIIADASMNTMLHNGIQRSVDSVEGWAREMTFKDGKGPTFNVHSEAVAAVTNRMIELSPDLLKRMGITEETLSRLAEEALLKRLAPASPSAA